MALMVRKVRVSRAMEHDRCRRRWDTNPLSKKLKEIRQVVPFSDKAKVFAGGFQNTPAELVDER